jgi:hypothetical protein
MERLSPDPLMEFLEKKYSGHKILDITKSTTIKTIVKYHNCAKKDPLTVLIVRKMPHTEWMFQGDAEYVKYCILVGASVLKGGDKPKK